METPVEPIDENQYTQGYNDAYWIHTAEPELAKELQNQQISGENDYLSGFRDGLRAEYDRNIAQDFKHLREEGNELDMDLEH